MPLFDTHAHLNDEQFANPQLVVEAAHQAGVHHIVAIGTTASSSEACVQLAERFDGVFAAVGIQPNYTHEASEADWMRVQELSHKNCVVAIGETGLDHYWDYADLGVQRDYFRRHMRLAVEVGKPLVIHMRDPKVESGQEPSTACAEDIYGELAAFAGGKSVSAIMHSYTGDERMADRFLELGLHISFAGMVTFKKSEALRQVAKRIPTDRVLIETDAPYLSPHPVRGTRPNEPALITHTAKCLAAVRGVEFELFARQTSQNAHKIFNIC